MFSMHGKQIEGNREMERQCSTLCINRDLDMDFLLLFHVMVDFVFHQRLSNV